MNEHPGALTNVASLAQPTLIPLSPAEFPSVFVSPGPTPDNRPPGKGAFDPGVPFATPYMPMSLQVLLKILRASRADVKSSNAEVAERGKQRLAYALSYLSGLLDAQGAMPPASQSGFDQLLGDSAKPDMDLALDQLEAVIVNALAPQSRGRIGEAIKDVGWTMMKAGLVAEVTAWLAPK